MLVIAALVTLGVGIWGAFAIGCDIAADHRKRRRPRPATRCGDIALLAACGSMALTAVHSLAAALIN